MIRLVNLSGKKHWNWPLEMGHYIIGRSNQCDLVIENDTVSKRHARIEVVDKQTINLTDLESHNGTAINGNKITATVQLKHNDIIALGSVEVKLTINETSEIKDTSVSIIDIDTDLTKATRLPIQEALRPLPSKITYDPKVFKAFSEMGKMLIIPGPEEDMLNMSLKLLQEIMPVERIAVFMPKGQEDDICLSACCIASQGCSSSFCISRTILQEVLKQKNAVLISDPQSDTKYAEQKSIIESRIKSAMAVPLYDDGKVFGILYADTTNPVHHYTEDYLKIAATFGNILAAKMSNCNLLKERQAKEILESELSVASQIQEQLLPKELPIIEGYKFNAFQIQCKQVGGDLYDIGRLDDGRILFLLADVSGKGMGAALLASNILASFRILYNTKDFNLLDATCHVSKQLLAFTRPGDFATLFIGLLNHKTGMLQYVNAGHNPPIIMRDNGKIEYLEASSVPIGALNLEEWQQVDCKLETGDFLFVFTDGIPEAINQQGELYGDDRLEKFILNNRKQLPEKLTESIMDEISRFIGDNPRSDDITMMILRRER